MPKQQDIAKTLVIGSGPIIIGQAAEFDYAGTQACRALKEENIQVVLCNSNPATIMTDTKIADRVYIEPLNAAVLESIIATERPDSLLATLGGQTGLNLAMELFESGVLEKYGVRLLGTSAEAIFKSEDRQAFRATMESLGEPCVQSVIVNNVSGAVDFAAEIGYPVIVRPAYTLGGTGGGIAYTQAQLEQICADGLAASRVSQCLIERCISGYKEIEFEVIRDSSGASLSICDMENVDSVGVHTGDSIVVAPCQTLGEEEFTMLKKSALGIIDALGIAGGCNVQFALNPHSKEYYVIEVNPRLSRSSALASKATAYPIARVATKIALGYNLDEISFGKDNVTADFEPNVTYTVIKIPRWPFDKFTKADKSLGTRMKATGEVMAIGANFEEAFMKALRSLELGVFSFTGNQFKHLSDQELMDMITALDDERIMAVAEALRRQIPLERLHGVTTINEWFLERLRGIVELETALTQKPLEKELLAQAKRLGLSDRGIALLSGTAEKQVRALRKGHGIIPGFKKVITSPSGEIGEYYYSTYGDATRPAPMTGCAVVLGSGPVRIGQGVEFDYCSVHAIWALKEQGLTTVMINNNPETVSTDFDTADRLYFEPLTAEDVLNILEFEHPAGVVTQFGGQTAIKLAKPVADGAFKLLGTQLKDINAAEDREVFDALLEKLQIPRPKGKTVFTADEAAAAANELGYPVLVRPSYVLGGQGMEIAYDEQGIREYMGIINRTEQEHPILVDKYITGREIEVDAVCDGDEILIPGIMEHIERAGVHSGDSISAYPATLSRRFEQRLIDYTRSLALGLRVRGLLNIQYILAGEDIYVIEVNPRSSRTVPYISKVTGIPLISLACRAMLGEKLATMGFKTGLAPKKPIFAIKVPVFSFEKLPDVEVSLGPEMKSTGEVLGLSRTFDEAFFKGQLAAGLNVLNIKKTALISVADNDKQELLPIAEDLSMLGFDIFATAGTANLLNRNYIPASVVTKKGEHDAAAALIESGAAGLIINTPTHGRERARFGFRLRRKAVERSIPVLTSLDTARALINSLKTQGTAFTPLCLQDLF